MNQRVYRSIEEPIRNEPSFEERWRGPDKGLITCWEVGRVRSVGQPELAEQAKKGELPMLGWKGGVSKQLKIKEKYGTLNYLALWQGIRGEDLDIDLSQEKEIICSATNIKVTFTSDASKYSEP
jgi:hypothetical protein